MDELIDLLEKVKLLYAHSQTIVKRREIDCGSQKGWNDQEIIFLGNEHCEWAREAEKRGENAQPLCMNVWKVTTAIFRCCRCSGQMAASNQCGFGFGTEPTTSSAVSALDVASTFCQRRWSWCHILRICQVCPKVNWHPESPSAP